MFIFEKKSSSRPLFQSHTAVCYVWHHCLGGCNNSDHIQALGTLHRGAARIIFNLSWDTPLDMVMEITKWDSILDLYKLSLIKLFYYIVIEKVPKMISDLVMWRHGP